MASVDKPGVGLPRTGVASETGAPVSGDTTASGDVWRRPQPWEVDDSDSETDQSGSTRRARSLAAGAGAYYDDEDEDEDEDAGSIAGGRSHFASRGSAASGHQQAALLGSGSTRRRANSDSDADGDADGEGSGGATDSNAAALASLAKPSAALRSYSARTVGSGSGGSGRSCSGTVVASLPVCLRGAARTLCRLSGLMPQRRLHRAGRSKQGFAAADDEDDKVEEDEEDEDDDEYARDTVSVASCLWGLRAVATLARSVCCGGLTGTLGPRARRGASSLSGAGASASAGAYDYDDGSRTDPLAGAHCAPSPRSLSVCLVAVLGLLLLLPGMLWRLQPVAEPTPLIALRLCPAPSTEAAVSLLAEPPRPRPPLHTHLHKQEHASSGGGADADAGFAAEPAAPAGWPIDPSQVKVFTTSAGPCGSLPPGSGLGADGGALQTSLVSPLPLGVGLHYAPTLLVPNSVVIIAEIDVIERSTAASTASAGATIAFASASAAVGKPAAHTGPVSAAAGGAGSGYGLPLAPPEAESVAEAEHKPESAAEFVTDAEATATAVETEAEAAAHSAAADAATAVASLLELDASSSAVVAAVTNTRTLAGAGAGAGAVTDGVLVRRIHVYVDTRPEALQASQHLGLHRPSGADTDAEAAAATAAVAADVNARATPPARASSVRAESYSPDGTRQTAEIRYSLIQPGRHAPRVHFPDVASALAARKAAARAPALAGADTSDAAASANGPGSSAAVADALALASCLSPLLGCRTPLPAGGSAMHAIVLGAHAIAVRRRARAPTADAGAAGAGAGAGAVIEGGRWFEPVSRAHERVDEDLDLDADADASAAGVDPAEAPSPAVAAAAAAAAARGEFGGAADAPSLLTVTVRRLTVVAPAAGTGTGTAAGAAAAPPAVWFGLERLSLTRSQSQGVPLIVAGVGLLTAALALACAGRARRAAGVTPGGK